MNMEDVNMMPPSNAKAEQEEKMSQTNPLPDCNKRKYVDDMTMFMAWHNWYLNEQNRMLSTLVYLQRMGMPHSFVRGIPHHATEGANHVSNGHTFHNENNSSRGGESVKLASFRKRISAELIDFFLLLLVKLFVISYCLGEQYMERFQYVLVIDENTTIEDLQATLMQAFLLRLIAVAYEGYCLSGTLPFSSGSTFGKKIMGLQVIRCDFVEELDAVGRTVLVSPGDHIGSLRSLIRASMKNAIISLFFPMLLPFHIMANHNRLIYDFATGTIVIERL